MTASDHIPVSDRAYIGGDDCAIATCPERQEFPDGPCDYCLRHSLQDHFGGSPRPEIAPKSEDTDR